MIAPMVTPPPINEEEAFQVAAALPSGERAAYLDEACAGHPTMRERIGELLAAHGEGDFMELETMDMSAEAVAMMERLKPEQAGERIGRYKLREFIADGGFGSVWVAEQKEPVRREVALKIIKLGMDTKEVIARFEQERQALALMDHPNIAKVLDAGATEWGRPFFVMELVRGIKITEYCDKASLPTAERLRLFIAVCQAVQHAHQKGIIHRDLKPSNILVTMHDGVPVPKVIDFGVAKATQSRRTEHTIYTQFQQMIGTPLYMSPEQAEMSGLDIDTRSDIYSLGVLLYELLTGRTAFDPETLKRAGPDEIRRIIREEEPPTPSVLLGTLPAGVAATLARLQRADAADLIGLLRGDLDWIVMKAIEKDRMRRYETANGLAMDIGRHLASEPVLARPPSQLYRLRRFVKRHRTGVISGASIAAALVVGTGVSTWQAERANSALARLRSTAPAFAAQARELVVAEDFDQAITKLNYAIELQSDSAEYLRERAGLLQSRQRLSQAAGDFRRILALRPDDAGAGASAELCERLAKLPREPGGEMPHAGLAELYAAMTADRRPAAQLMPLARALGRENQLLLQYWLDRLHSLPNASGTPIRERLKAGEHGTLDFDLSGTKIADLSPLRGMPIESLDLTGCTEVRSIEVLRGMPLRKLDLTRTGVVSLDPLADLPALEDLTLREISASDLSPLHGLQLRKLRLDGTGVNDLSALHGMPLAHLELGRTRAMSLAPLEGMPLKTLECSYSLVEDFAPLAKLPLERLALQGVRVGDLAFVREMPLKELVLTDAREMHNVRILNEVKTLELLVLPGDPLKLGVEEINGIESLKKHGGLQRISDTLALGRSADNADAATVFWRKWDATMLWWRALRAAGIKVDAQRLPDETWAVFIMEQPLQDLAMFAGSNVSVLNVTGCRAVADLSPLHGLPLTTLSMAGTAVTNLSPLGGMALRELWMAATKVTDLAPLRGMPLKKLYMDQCPLLADLAPLQDMPDLEEILLPENAGDVASLHALPKLRRISYTYDGKTGGPASAAAAFWERYHDLSWLHALRVLATSVSVRQLANATWKVTINDASFDDLSILKDAPISILELGGTSVADLRPLAGLPLRQLRIEATPCSVVSPLASIATLESIVLPTGATDLASLRGRTSIKRLAFEADENGAPTLDAAAFWAAFDAKNAQ